MRQVISWLVLGLRQSGGVGRIDPISRLPLPKAELLVAAIRAKGARLAVPGIVDLSDLVADNSGVTRIVLEAVQEMLLRVALQTARDDYETRRERQRQGIEIARRAGRYTGRKPDTTQHRRILSLRHAGRSIARTAQLTECSTAQVNCLTKLQRSKAAQTAADGAEAGLKEGTSDPVQISASTSAHRRRIRLPRCWHNSCIGL